MGKRNIKLVVSYDGSKFFGWQKQKGCSTIQETLENCIEKILKEEVVVVGCGRTDAKVHAISYVANFTTSKNLTSENLKRAINSEITHNILVKEAEEVDDTFHSRFDAKKKIYRYLLSNVRTPFFKDYVAYIKSVVDIEKMEEATSFFCGEHNFKAFQASGSNIKNTIRRIYKIKIKKENFLIDRSIKVIAIEITANGFLYKMARNIVGTLIYVGQGKLLPETIPQFIKSQDRKLIPPTAKPEGLYLKKVYY